ncbi:unnamed protein product [Nesidiocoris tenuis]|uniref:Uncharacterized protein n=1 Tax=Nesidiocoris tenuis TaxID=355587 RepID=A0A6H5G7N4_9HEMI|nr:unnamed protein product [Nesidiocoris tenuis]
MAPLKQLQPTALPATKSIKTRSQILPMKKELSKRKAEESPLKRLTVKRSALNELTNVTSSFVISDYLERQKDLSASMRAILVDWMVDIQESYELVHESLYLGVKLVDLFLSKHVINRDRLQLVGAACLFVACKYDERLPPSLDDFMATCDNQYQATEFLKMEVMILRTVDYSLGIPLSYRFLRRYARCAKYDMPTLTLARYILEVNLMNYKTVRHSDSKMAAAALFLALQMKGRRTWTKTLEYYSGYRTEDFIKIAYDLNDYLAAIPRGLKTVKSKYSHT